MYQAVETDPMLGSVRSPRVDKPGATGSGSIRTMRLEAPTRRCNDVLFAILFIANVLTVAVFAFWKGIPALVKQAKELADDDKTATNVPEAPDGDFTKVFALAAALVAISIGVSAFWMKFLMAYATQLIRIALWLNVVLIVIFAIVGFSVQPIMSAIMLAVAGLNVWFIFAVSSRIAFAAANLKSACAAVGEHMGVFWVALFMIIKQFAWLMLWSLCAIGVYQHFKDVDPECDKAEASNQAAPSHFCGGTSGGLALFFLLISVYWGQQVIQNVLTCTTAGVVATWWYQPESKKVTFGAFYRSLTTSFGSICFGSLIVAILHALRSMASILKEKAREDDNVALACVACMAECVLNCIESIMEYINQWAYVYVGIYGYDFRTSGKAVTDLFVNRGFTAVINDDLTQTALTIGAFGVGFVGLVVGLVMVQFSPPSWFAALGDKQSAFAVLGTIGFLSGIGMAMVLANVIITALHTVFVCFAEDPIALSRNHPQEYETLVNGWRQFHGEALQGAYGSAV